MAEMDLPDRPKSGWSRSATAVALYTGLALAALVWRGAHSDLNIFIHPAMGSSGLGLLSVPAGVGLGLAVVLLSRLSVARFSWARLLHREFHDLLGPLHDREVFTIALASAVGEEFFFRGAMMADLGLWPSSAIFALLHVGPGWRYLPWTLSAFAVGTAMGGAFAVFGNLGAPIAAHFTINYLNLRHIRDHELPKS
ncbi:MAG: lysostaphin resistance A-like protein [bacterium]